MMGTPFEELEYLAEYLPEEGESVVVTRRSGELLCESLAHLPQREPARQSDFYGRLVHADARLRQLAYTPVWVCLLTGFWLSAAAYSWLGLGLESWFLHAGLLLGVVMTAQLWIRHRRAIMFRAEIRPVLTWQMQRTQLDWYSLIGQIRQQRDLQVLLAETTRWVQ